MEKENKKPVYKLDVKEKDHGVYAISIVDSPAIDKNFMLFTKQEDNKLTKLEFNSNEFSKDIKLEKDRQIITGPAMIPDYKIFRKDRDGNEYFVEIDKEQIELVSLKFAQGKYNQNANMNHDKNSIIDNITYYETWIVTDPANDKSNALGFKDIHAGTWMVSAKIEDTETWNKIKEGDFNGFSIEGLFNLELEQSNFNKIENKIEIYTITKNDKTMLKKILEKFENFMTKEMKFQDLTLQDGTKLMIDEATGLVTLEDGSSPKDGEYILDDMITELFVLNGMSVDEIDFDAAMLDKATSEEPVVVVETSKISAKPITVKIVKDDSKIDTVENSKVEFESMKTKIEALEKYKIEMEKTMLELSNTPATTHTHTGTQEHYRTKATPKSKDESEVEERVDQILKQLDKIEKRNS